MIAIKNDEHYDKLSKRRAETLRTLKHLRTEQRTIDENREWIDKAAYESRRHLLSGLADWYANETARIDAALRQITEGRSGVCLRCREPIDARRLKRAPGAVFCAACQGKREDPADL